MATAWTLAATDICTDALEHLGVIGDGETASAGDMQTALRGLDAILKELPLAGYSWPKLSAETALAWINGQTITLPADYYAYPVLWKSLNGQKPKLTQINHAQWVAMADRAQTGESVTHFYISPANVLYLWPVPAVDPVLTIQYQRLVDDAVLATAPDLPSYWHNPLGYGVANEIALKFGAEQGKRVEIAQRWGVKRDRALESSIASEVISFEVRD